ncbi:hypothetical protein MmTuc01_1905 [Methanosarcina mazei Tuc01]|uniref:Uncharacterized protein n=1 Tax=Methanosarcina mazei Tuc01 TaxID=1236903 RepID=M1QJT9_METMZ|nr:hypothetical protein MmTuc01_1905 [Methanosarcina mazei Tuc01]
MDEPLKSDQKTEFIETCVYIFSRKLSSFQGIQSLFEPVF